MVLDIKEVVAIIKTGEWQKSLQFITADIAKRKAGVIHTFGKFRIARRKGLEESNLPTTSASGIKKSAAHNQNFTINLELENGEIRKVHPVLITRLNDFPVV